MPLLEQRKCCFLRFVFLFLLSFPLPLSCYFLAFHHFFRRAVFFFAIFFAVFLVTVLYFVRLCLCKHFIFIKVAFLIIFPFSCCAAAFIPLFVLLLLLLVSVYFLQHFLSFCAFFFSLAYY